MDKKEEYPLNEQILQSPNKEESIELHDKLDEEALSVIFRLYDKTFKDLVDR